MIFTFYKSRATLKFFWSTKETNFTLLLTYLTLLFFHLKRLPRLWSGFKKKFIWFFFYFVITFIIQKSIKTIIIKEIKKKHCLWLIMKRSNKLETLIFFLNYFFINYTCISWDVRLKPTCKIKYIGAQLSIGGKLRF